MTFLRMAVTVSRAMILEPMAAWIATSNIWRGMSSRIFRDQGLAAIVGEVAVHDDGERVDGSPPMRMSILTMGETQVPARW
jgi:hypothetical protein